jgi:hypothetical protein
MSSHFIPSPRSWMILVSSSGDHLDCFLAGDSAGWVPDCRLVGTVPAGANRGGSTVAGGMVAGGTDADRVVGGPTAGAGDVSSSLGLRRREISTLPECEREYTGKGRGCC